jgi:hypothetical protein
VATKSDGSTTFFLATQCCGLGGLDFKVVADMIAQAHEKNLKDYLVRVYEPG